MALTKRMVAYALAMSLCGGLLFPDSYTRQAIALIASSGTSVLARFDAEVWAFKL